MNLIFKIVCLCQILFYTLKLENTGIEFKDNIAKIEKKDDTLDVNNIKRDISIPKKKELQPHTFKGGDSEIIDESPKSMNTTKNSYTPSNILVNTRGLQNFIRISDNTYITTRHNITELKDGKKHRKSFRLKKKTKRRKGPKFNPKFIDYFTGFLGGKQKVEMPFKRRPKLPLKKNLTDQELKVIKKLLEDMKCVSLYELGNGEDEKIFSGEVPEAMRKMKEENYVQPGVYKLKYFKPKDIPKLEYCKNKFLDKSSFWPIGTINDGQLEFINKNRIPISKPKFLAEDEKIDYDNEEIDRTDILNKFPHVLKVLRIEAKSPKKQLSFLANAIFLGDTLEFTGVYQNKCFYNWDEYSNYYIMYIERAPYGDINSIKDISNEKSKNQLDNYIYDFYYLPTNSITWRLSIAQQVVYSAIKLLENGYVIEDFSTKNVLLLDRYIIRLAHFDKLKSVDETNDITHNLKYSDIYGFTEGDAYVKLMEKGFNSQKKEFGEAVREVVKELIVENINKKFKSGAEAVYEACVIKNSLKKGSGKKVMLHNQKVKEIFDNNILRGLESRLYDFENLVEFKISKITKTKKIVNMNKCFELAKTPGSKKIGMFFFRTRWFELDHPIHKYFLYDNMKTLKKEWYATYINCFNENRERICENDEQICQENIEPENDNVEPENDDIESEKEATKKREKRALTNVQNVYNNINNSPISSEINRTQKLNIKENISKGFEHDLRLNNDPRQNEKSGLFKNKKYDNSNAKQNFDQIEMDTKPNRHNSANDNLIDSLKNKEDSSNNMEKEDAYKLQSNTKSITTDKNQQKMI